MYRSSTAPSLIRLKDNLHTDSSPMVTGYICLERCLELYPNIPLSTRISILLDVSSELAHLHSQNPPITVGNITKCVMLTSGLKATLVEDASGEKNRLSDSQGFERHTHVHDIYQFGLLILKVVGKDTLSGADNKIQHEKGLERHCMHLSNLAMSCLQPDPLVRPSADTLRSTLQQLNASFCDCAKERTESKQMNTKLIDHSKFSAELEEENSYLRARCQDLEAENERLRKMCDELICAQRDQKPNVSFAACLRMHMYPARIHSAQCIHARMQYDYLMRILYLACICRCIDVLLCLIPENTEQREGKFLATQFHQAFKAK